jgi:hypothetical protein
MLRAHFRAVRLAQPSVHRALKVARAGAVHQRVVFVELCGWQTGRLVRATPPGAPDFLSALTERVCPDSERTKPVATTDDMTRATTTNVGVGGVAVTD